jgi:hypothetical protein
MAFLAAPAAAGYIAAATAAVAAAGAAVQGYSSYQQAKSAAKVDEQNAQLAEQQGESEAAAIREKARRLSGANRSAIGASGVDISGSFLDALNDSDINAELDAQTAKWNRKVEGANYSSRAAQSRSAASGALVNAGVGAGTAALSGYGNWKAWTATNPSVAA